MRDFDHKEHERTPISLDQTVVDHIIHQLAEEIRIMINRNALFYNGLWTAKDVAVYLKVTPRQVLERYAAMPGFPKAIRLPSPSGGLGHPRWKAKEIIAWTERHQGN